MIETLSSLTLTLVLVLVVLFGSSRLLVVLLRRFYFAQKDSAADVTIGFFHPYCHAGGGGERVLWCAIQSLAAAASLRRLRIVVFTGDVGVPAEEILKRATERFGITMPADLDLRCVYISTRHWLEASRYPRFTLLGQALGSMVVAFDCLKRCTPDIWVDSMGAAFTFPVAKLAGCHVACYTHYPMVSTDMLARVQERRPDHNNAGTIASSASATRAKVLYYTLFAALYGAVGRFADVVMVNSKWTKAHIDQLWGTGNAEDEAGGSGGGGGESWSGSSGSVSRPGSSSGSGGGVVDPRDTAEAEAAGARRRRQRQALRAAGAKDVPADEDGEEGGEEEGGRSSLSSSSSRVVTPSYVVYPPCNTDALKSLPIGNRTRTIASVAQFRPEKDHPLQLRAFAEFRGRDLASYGDVRLVLIGGVRGDDDAKRVDNLKKLAAELGISDAVDFRTNLPFSELRSSLGSASATLHTMWNEHFGIGVVESMAAGAITLAHNSGGPKDDIVVPWDGVQTGFLASTPSEYADALEAVFRTPPTASASAGASSAAAATATTTSKKGKKGKAAKNEAKDGEADANDDAATAEGEDESVSSSSSSASSSSASASSSTRPVPFPDVDLRAMAVAARASVSRFSDAEFGTAWYARLVPLIREVEHAKAKDAGRA